MKDFDEIARQCKSTKEALSALYDAGATVEVAIVALRNGRRVSVDDCKAEILQSPYVQTPIAEAENLLAMVDQIGNTTDEER